MRAAISALMVLAAFACAGRPPPDEGVPAVDEYLVPCGAEPGGAFTSDENYVKFIEAAAAGKLTLDACRSPELLEPGLGTRLGADTSPLFRFRPTPLSCGSAAMPPKPGCPLGRRKSALGVFVETIEPLLWGVAHAHCPAFSGENYLLRIFAEGVRRPIYVAMLSVTERRPDGALWRSAVGPHRGQRVEVTIERAVFARGNIEQGPFVSPTIARFEVDP